MAGVGLYALAAPRSGPRVSEGRRVAGAVALANLPDVDMVWSWVATGDPNVYHGWITHSLVVAGVVALVVARAWAPWSYWRGVWFSFLLIGAHDLIDASASQSLGWHTGEGTALYAPLIDGKWASPFTLFYGVRHKDLEQLISRTNLWHLLFEITVFGGFAFWAFRRRRRLPGAGR